MSDNKFKVIDFKASSIPLPTESKTKDDSTYVTWGLDNMYPYFLLHLFENCSLHSSLVQSKGEYVMGQGLQYQDGTDVKFKANAQDDIKELVSKIIGDYLIFNSFAVEVTYSLLGEPIEFHHVPAHYVRTNKSKTKFWVNEDWKLNSRAFEVLDRWSTNINSEGTTKLFYFDGYVPSINKTYLSPEYGGAIKSIQTLIEIDNFNFNNITGHFSVSTLISFFEGSNVPDEQKAETLKALERSYTGANGNKMIVGWYDQNDKAPEVTNVSPGDWDKAYIEVQKSVKDTVYTAHKIVSPILFGNKTEGQLGGTTEMETAYSIFRKVYVESKRYQLESALNLMFTGFKGVTGIVKFGDAPLFPPVMSDELKKVLMTKNEMRKEFGLDPIDGGDTLIDAPTPTFNLNPPPAAPAPEAEVKKKSKGKLKELTDEDFDLIKDYGVHADAWELISEFTDTQKVSFDKESDIADYVIKNDIKSLSLDELNALIKKDTGLNVAKNELRNILKQLNDAGVVKVAIDSDGTVKITPNKVADVPDTDRIEVRYKYEKRPEIQGPDLIEGSRNFCVKMINNNRLYLRSEIQQMSALFGFDVFKYCGKYYHNPETGETTPYCRHRWVGYSVKRKPAE